MSSTLGLVAIVQVAMLLQICASSDELFPTLHPRDNSRQTETNAKRRSQIKLTIHAVDSSNYATRSGREGHFYFREGAIGAGFGTATAPGLLSRLSLAGGAGRVRCGDTRCDSAFASAEAAVAAALPPLPLPTVL